MQSQKYICQECYSLFEVHTTSRDKRPFCVGCGDYVGVRVYREPLKKKKNYKTWDNEELKKLEELINKGVKTHTIAFLLDRSYGSVRLQIKRVKERELN